ncbi:glycogen debranching protein [Stakelama tenebrarum]|uniref:Glycogen-debranching protein n=1 Tax=Stakelama tenebrarum TaxID=2711215 RepID=A0A6G6Y2T1_9SPHN|nr:isoamylase [Sphingosinithalassobacter tenebrarum]QIG78876.1 glycogen-debranching protein [Sphingosinithalassobacter tenebrarum]
MTANERGHNFAIFSRHATAMWLLLFRPGESEPCAEFPLDPLTHRTGEIWHAEVTGAGADFDYAVRANGPARPDLGHRFDASRVLLDPYACDVREQPDRSFRARMGTPEFDWGDDRRPHHGWSETVIYEAHVRGLTWHESAGVAHPGRYLGLIEKIPHLQSLGITAVELLPVQAFPCAAPASPVDGHARANYWGYDPVCFMAPHPGYADVDPTIELKTLIRALHKAGIEVILDVVFNHTAEGGAAGPTLSLKGLDNATYYMIEPETGEYHDFTGCGNTVDCSRPVVHALIIAALRHWVVDYHVDGFRFDLATVLGRDSDGTLLPRPPLLEEIAEDPILGGVKLIAEAWDAGGAEEVGRFPGVRWAEWNSYFRDDVRRFWRGDPGMTGAFATRLCGSQDLFGDGGKTPVNSINLVTSHDGFTLADLVSYGHRHNEANGDANRDGPAQSHSDNNGVEGPSDDPEIVAMRDRQIRNFLLTLMVSRGVPMLLAGDECKRTQRGNSNAWCQDNDVSWFDWRLVADNAELVAFVRRLIAFRRAHPVLSAERFYTAEDITWLGADGGEPQWQGADNLIGCVIEPRCADGADRLAMFFNASEETRRFLLAGGPWYVVFDTSGAMPAGRRVASENIALPARCSLVLRITPWKE